MRTCSHSSERRRHRMTDADAVAEAPVVPAPVARAEAAAAVAEAPGVWSIRVPFPDNPLGYTLVYALETAAGGPVLVDAGWDDPASLAALERGLAAIGTAVSDVRGVLVTHHHPDHHGLAGR